MLTRRQTILTAVAGGVTAALPARLAAQAAAPAPAAAPAASPAPAPAATDSAVPVFLTPFEHASLMLTLGGKRFLIDPVGAPAPYLAAGEPDVILVTHEHGDHFDPETLAALAADSVTLVVNPAVAEKLPEPLKARARVMKNGDTAEIAGIPVEAVPAYNITPDRLQYHPQGRDNGYVFSAPEGRIYVAGDTEDTPEFRAQKDILLAIVPMNLPYTMTADQAAAGVAAMAPRQVSAYHHRGTDPAAFAEKLKAAGAATEVIVIDWYPGNDDPTGKKPD